MTVSDHTQAVLLLTARLPNSARGSPRPLTASEWGRFAAWLKERSVVPERLLGERPRDLLRGWSDKQLTCGRIEALLNRGPALALAMNRWLGAGLWVVTRSEPDYPARLKRKLGRMSPAVLFGCGNRALLSGGGLAVVGSRNASDADLRSAKSIGSIAASQGQSVISGGARGVDDAAMLGALQSEGTVVGVLADSLLRRCATAKYRRHIRSNDLALFSTVHPEAPFLVGSAMQRNKFIYCLADAALVVHSGTKGGTWSGATENLKRRWTNLWVMPATDPRSGNAMLEGLGASPLEEELGSVRVSWLFHRADRPPLFSGLAAKQPVPTVRPAPGSAKAAENPARTQGPPASAGPALDAEEVATRDDVRLAVSAASETDVSNQEDVHEGDTAIREGRDTRVRFYGLFLEELRRACRKTPVRPRELAEAFDLHSTQVNAWLKRAESERKVSKLSRPVRYRWISSVSEPLFDK